MIAEITTPKIATIVNQLVARRGFRPVFMHF